MARGGNTGSNGNKGSKYGYVYDMYYGWRTESIVNKRIYCLWQSMWRRCGYQKYWLDCTVCDEWVYLSNFIEWIESQPRYKEFLETCSDTPWSIEKDQVVENNKLYSPKTCILIPRNENSKNVWGRLGNPISKKVYDTRRKPIIGISTLQSNKIRLYLSCNDVRNDNFTPSNVIKCLTRGGTSKGYKWYYVNYKHNKTYRIKGGFIK